MMARAKVSALLTVGAERWEEVAELDFHKLVMPYTVFSSWNQVSSDSFIICVTPREGLIHIVSYGWMDWLENLYCVLSSNFPNLVFSNKSYCEMQLTG